MRTHGSWLWPLAIVAALGGCDTEETLDPQDLAAEEIEPRSMYVGGPTLLPMAASTCFVVGPSHAGFPTQEQLDHVDESIKEWEHPDNAIELASDTWYGGFGWVEYDEGWFATNCTQDTSGHWQETLRIFVDVQSYSNSPTLLPTLTVPGCSAVEPRGSQVYDDGGQPVIDPQTGLYVAGNSVWSMFPGEIASNPTCLYTTHLTPWLQRNNFLHETGHSLGFSHEHDRADATCQPGGVDFPGTRRITSYDQSSVMHYVQDCVDGTSAPGNWGSDGLTRLDRLAAEMLYPAWTNAGMIGDLVGWEGGAAHAVQSDWGFRGATTDPAWGVVPYFFWLVDGTVVSTAPVPTNAELAVGAGDHQLTLVMVDMWGRWFSGSAPLEILASKAEYDTRIGAISAIGWM